MSSTLRFTVDSEQDGQRIDKFLQQQVEGMSRSQAQKWLAAGQVLVQGKAAGKNDKLKAGMQVEVCLPETALAAQEEDGDERNWGELLTPTEEPQPQQIPLQIVYEDEHLLVVDKPKHMVVHPGAGNSEGTLVNALLYHCGGKLARCNGIERQGIVHRIDKDTSGLLVCAKDDESYLGLSSQIQQHTVDRFYETVVYGKVKQEEGVIDLPIGRSLKDRKKMAVRTDCIQPDGNIVGAKQAITHYQVLGRYDGFTHLRCRLETGRTHQIRVHLAYLGHPVAGDELYGPKKAIKRLEGQCLHARALGFVHPITGEHLYFESPLPPYFTSFLKTLKPVRRNKPMEKQQPFDGILLVSDIDGTLTDLTQVSRRNIEAIERFIRLGGHFTLCTGRPRCALGEILRQVPVNAPIITINGGYIYSEQSEEVLFTASLPDTVQPFVYHLLERFEQIGAMLVEPDNYWVIRWGDESIEGVAQRRDMYLREGCCKPYTPQTGPHSWHKVVLIVPPQQIPEVRAYIEQANPQGFYPVQSDAFYLELVAEGVDKGKGMRLIQQQLGMNKTAAIGDRENDLAMLRAADFSATPCSGDRNLQKEVDFIVDSCDNGAVADFIERLEQRM